MSPDTELASQLLTDLLIGLNIYLCLSFHSFKKETSFQPNEFDGDIEQILI